MRILTLEEIREKLQDRKITQVARKTGLGYETVLRIARGQVANCNYETLKRLSEYLEDK